MYGACTCRRDMYLCALCRTACRDFPSHFNSAVELVSRWPAVEALGQLHLFVELLHLGQGTDKDHAPFLACPPSSSCSVFHPMHSTRVDETFIEKGKRLAYSFVIHTWRLCSTTARDMARRSRIAAPREQTVDRISTSHTANNLLYRLYFALHSFKHDCEWLGFHINSIHEVIES